MKKTAQRAMYALVGAPVVAYEKTKAMGEKLVEAARTDYDAAAERGEKVTKKVTSTNIADEIGSRVDLEGIQDRVEKLRDQLEDALSQWRESFRPGEAAKTDKPAPAAPSRTRTVTTGKPAAKTAAAKKPAAKTTATKKPAAKKPAAKKPVSATK